MKRSRFNENQILKILKEAESELTIGDVCRKHGVSEATFYVWRNKYNGMNESELKRLKQLEEENRRLKHLYAELSLDHSILKEVVEKKL
jgi:putative transposase